MTQPKPNSDQGGASPNSEISQVLITESPVPMENAVSRGKSTPPECTPKTWAGSKVKFRTDVFLYRMLLGIFITEAIFLGFSFQKCAQLADSNTSTIQEQCPRLGEKSESLFGIAIATTLSLLTGQAVTNLKKKD